MHPLRTLLAILSVVEVAWASGARAADADTDTSPEEWSLHFQTTFTDQFHPAFTSPYRGTNSLDPGSRGDETFDLTIFAGMRLWRGGEAYVNPEVDQGFGLSDTYGVAGFPSGEAYKIGDTHPYVKLPRLFIRQTFDLGGEVQRTDPGANQLGGTRTADNLIITIGKISVPDIFDANTYAHDPRHDYLNWTILDAGAFDYAADSWAYTYGGAAEWTQSWWSLRTGLFDLSKVPNMPHLETGFRQFEIDAEAEERHTLFGHDGRLKLLGFINRGRMGDYNDAIALGLKTHTTPNTALVRNYASRPGASLNFEQHLAGDLGMFARASINDGSKETYEFTDVNQSVSAGLSLNGNSWSRASDTVGAGAVANGISDSAQHYFAAGGLGILIGDGRLPHYSTENILETYYSAQLTKWVTASADYQLVLNPAYNPQRGPVSVLGARLHAEL
ncbi:MAG: carbohydrate porin [Rhizomicrobium sp.]|jgi:high affinity Mn2+ porin